MGMSRDKWSLCMGYSHYFGMRERLVKRSIHQLVDLIEIPGSIPSRNALILLGKKCIPISHANSAFYTFEVDKWVLRSVIE
jgi:hypothetical protein